MIRRIAALVFVAVLVLFAFLPARGAPYRVQKFVLWGGSAFDSTTKTRWIPVLHANHVTIRTWSTHAAYVANTDAEADSIYSDSISTCVFLFSDSTAFTARDSAGTLVTSSSLIPTTSAHGDPFPVGGDSVSITPTSATATMTDTVTTMTLVTHAPINVALRSPVNGSGFITRVAATAPGSVSTYGDGEITKRLMGIKITPVRRATSATVSATVPNRVNGLKGFRMEAWVYYQDTR